MGTAGDLWMLGETFGDGHRVGAMGAHAQRQGLEPLNEEESVERAHRRSEVAQQGDPHLEDVGDRSERLYRLRPDGTVIARIRLVQERKAVSMLFPVEIAAVDDDAADRGAVTADIFRRRVHDDGGTVLDRPAQHRGRGVVDDQRYAELAPDPRDLADWKHFELRVGQGLGVIAAGPRIGRAAEAL